MADPFFASARPAKRKRPSSDGPSSSRGRGGSRGSSSGRGRPGSRGGPGRGRGRGDSRGGRGGRGGDREREDSVEDDVGPTMNASDDEDDEARAVTPPAGSDDEDDERETAAQKRLRLAKTYIASLEEANKRDPDDVDAAELDRDLIAERLQQDALADKGDLHVFIADALAQPLPADIHYTSTSKGHRLPVTAAVASPDGKHLYTASKDGSLIKWDLQSAFASPAGTLRRLVYCPKHVARKAKALDGKKGKQVDSAATPTTIGHAGEILTLSISDDGEHLASGGTDRLVGVWDVADASCGWRGGLRGHKDTIAAVAFRKASTQAYTSAYDRTLKIFDLASLSYIETLFGHQDRVHDLDCLKAEMPLSAGGRDKTVRLWKVADESQLVFRAGVTSRIREVIEGGAVDEDAMDDGTAPTKEVRYIEGSTDCVAMIDDGHFLSGGDSGSICLWSTTRKKPIFTQSLAHGTDDRISETEGPQRHARWITSLACLPYADVFASGSWDGSIRLWKLDRALRTFTKLHTLPALGFVNALQLVQPASEPASLLVVAALGQEPRLGRWMRIKEARNVGLVARLVVGEARVTL